MEPRQDDALRRIYQADEALSRDGRDDTFLLIHTGGGGAEVLHAGWDESFAAPSEHVIDDLVELGHVRLLEPVHDRTRKFAITMRGRQQAKALVEAASFGASIGGRAPDVRQTLSWLVAVEADEPSAFDAPPSLLKRAEADGLIETAGRDALARRILQLIDEGYLSADDLSVDQIGAEQALGMLIDLKITMKGHEVGRVPSSATTVNVFADVVNSQIAQGDINNITNLVQVLVEAEREIDALDGPDEDVKCEAKSLFARMRGAAAGVGGVIVSEAGAQLAASVLAKVMGVPLD